MREDGWVDIWAFRALAGPDTKIEVGRVHSLGAGLSRRSFVTDIEVSPDPTGLSGPYVAKLPGWEPEEGLDQRTARETAILHRLAGLKLRFRLPKVVAMVPEADGIVVVETFVPGLELGLRSGKTGGRSPWEVIGHVAADIHAIDPALVSDLVPGYPSRRAHGVVALAEFDGLSGLEVEEAVAWARAHLPPDEPPVLLHGDLLGHNILVHPDEPPAVFDWEYASLGDPAYDLAIVTRGVRRPFKVHSGLTLLVDAYLEAGGVRISAVDVYFHELCLAARWVHSAYRGGRGVEPPQQALARISGILRRAEHAQL